MEANNYWRAIEVTLPEGFVDPWQATLGDYMPEDDCIEYMCGYQMQPSFNARDLEFYVDDHFLLDSR
eukprot:7561802-Karenia_brevis.AAC.1